MQTKTRFETLERSSSEHELFVPQGTPDSPQTPAAAGRGSAHDEDDAPPGGDPPPTPDLPGPVAPPTSGSRNDYVFIPTTTSTEELVTHGNSDLDYHTTKVEGSGRAGPPGLEGEEEQSHGEPPPYTTTVQYPTAPQGGAVHPSGYFVLP